MWLQYIKIVGTFNGGLDRLPETLDYTNRSNNRAWVQATAAKR